MNLDDKIGEIPRIGERHSKKLKKIGIQTIRDLLYYFPIRYNDFSDIVPIKKAKSGHTACMRGKIIEIGTARTFRKWMFITEAIVEDESGSIRAVWFNQPYIEKYLKEDNWVCLAGKVALGKGGLYLSNPAYEKISEEDVDGKRLTHTGRIIPVYSETKGITSRWLRFVIKLFLAEFYKKIPEVLPLEILKKHKFLPVHRAIWQVHFPDSFESADAAKARFSFEELFLLQLSVLSQKAKMQKSHAPPCPMDTDSMKKFTKSLEFKLTDSQKQSAYQILKDLEKTAPMSRLLQGDVGSGKTVVAAMAALNVAKSGYQAAFMAPTEILAKQHFSNVSKPLNDFNLSIGLLTSKESKIFRDGEQNNVKKAAILEDIKNGQISILIGTHALIQKEVFFKNLAFVVVDEQHRFGVGQRMAMIRKTNTLVPHLLSMTATPIPRTLALTVYGDLDLSLIKEMPKDRKKVKTFVVDPEQRNKAYEFIKKEAKEGRGIFVICPRIEVRSLKLESGGEKIEKKAKTLGDVKAVKDEYEKLSKEIFPDLRIAMLYGKMKPDEKEKIMTDFRDGKVDILVSTSVVEVGVDVPRATVMMIEGAERFGLAQLHQFRGRVGRSDMQSHCFLFTTERNQQNRKRLKAMEKLNSGFELAQKDLEIRGPGQVYGTQQWGLPDIAMQGLSNIFLVEKTRAAAKEILEKDPELRSYPLLKESLRKFEERIHFE